MSYSVFSSGILIFKGHQIIIPQFLCKLIALVHNQIVVKKGKVSRNYCNTSRIQSYVVLMTKTVIQNRISYNIKLTDPKTWHRIRQYLNMAHSSFTGYVTRVTRRLSHVEQELSTLPEHLNSPPFLAGFVLLDL